METDGASRPSTRPRPWLLVALGLAVIVFLAAQFWSSNPAATPGRASNPRGAAARRAPGAVDPVDLNVRLDWLQQRQVPPGEASRNPFRFQPKAPTPAPPSESSKVAMRPTPQPDESAPVGPPPPPPIALKFIGTVEPTPGDKVAAFSDCRYTFRGREGEIVDGRYRLVRIGVESVVMEYVDGRGRTTIRLSGLECVGK